MNIRVCGFRDAICGVCVNTTSRAGHGWSSGLSPFLIGPCDLYWGAVSQNMENAWQYSKVYKRHIGKDGEPTPDYFEWAMRGWKKGRADRYPMGKGAEPEYSYWRGDHLPYIEARRTIYCPLYCEAVEGTEAYKILKKEAKKHELLWLWDFDGYDHKSQGMSYEEVLNNPFKKMGHAFVLAMMLEGQRVWETT